LKTRLLINEAVVFVNIQTSLFTKAILEKRFIETVDKAELI
jgi:hypothetical protein